MTADALYSLADRSILFATLQGRAWKNTVATLGEHRWDVDVEARTVTFSALADRTRRFVVPAELVATVTGGTALWGWAHPQGDPQGTAAVLRAHGEHHGVPELTTPQPVFTADYTTSPETWNDDTATVIGLVAAEITGEAPVFVAETGDIRAVYLLRTTLPAPVLAPAVDALRELTGTLPLRDARTSVWGLARLAGWRFEWADAAYTAARIADATARVRVGFDAEARVSGIEREA